MQCRHSYCKSCKWAWSTRPFRIWRSTAVAAACSWVLLASPDATLHLHLHHERERFNLAGAVEAAECVRPALRKVAHDGRPAPSFVRNAAMRIATSLLCSTPPVEPRATEAFTPPTMPLRFVICVLLVLQRVSPTEPPASAATGSRI